MNNRYMEMALEIAFSRLGITSPNPPVGAVIVKDNIVAGSGGTCVYGCNHAEIEAINSAGNQIEGADLYVTLEPCNHYGKTPPCTEAIIASGIKCVYVPIEDPNPLVAGKGLLKLQSAGIKVVMMSHYASHAITIIRPFIKYITKNQPYVLHKSAITLDGHIASRTGDSKWISSESSRYIAHKLRAKVDAVIIGKNTLIKDNPRLDVRINSFSKEAIDLVQVVKSDSSMAGSFLHYLLTDDEKNYYNPVRIIIGLPDTLTGNENIFFDDNYYFFEKKETIDKIIKKSAKMKQAVNKLNLYALESKDNCDTVNQVIQKLYENKIMFVLLEGGGRIAGSFFDNALIDQYLYFICPIIAGNGLPVINAQGKEFMDNMLRLQEFSSKMISNELIVNGYKDKY